MKCLIFLDSCDVFEWFCIKFGVSFLKHSVQTESSVLAALQDWH